MCKQDFDAQLSTQPQRSTEFQTLVFCKWVKLVCDSCPKSVIASNVALHHHRSSLKCIPGIPWKRCLFRSRLLLPLFRPIKLLPLAFRIQDLSHLPRPSSLPITPLQLIDRHSRVVLCAVPTFQISDDRYLLESGSSSSRETHTGCLRVNATDSFSLHFPPAVTLSKLLLSARLTRSAPHLPSSTICPASPCIDCARSWNLPTPHRTQTFPAFDCCTHSRRASRQPRDACSYSDTSLCCPEQTPSPQAVETLLLSIRPQTQQPFSTQQGCPPLKSCLQSTSSRFCHVKYLPPTV